MITKNDELKEYLYANFPKILIRDRNAKFEDIFASMSTKLIDEKTCFNLIDIDSGSLYEIPLVCCTQSVLKFGIKKCLKEKNIETRLWLYCYLYYKFSRRLHVFDGMLMHDNRLRWRMCHFFDDCEIEEFNFNHNLSPNAQVFHIRIVQEFLKNVKVNVYLIDNRTNFEEEEIKEAFVSFLHNKKTEYLVYAVNE